MRGLRAAVLFLTRLPLPGGAEVSQKAFDRGPAWFPVVGAGLGAGVGCLGLLPLDPLLAATLVAASTAFLTGGLHLDGLADSCDGLGGGRDRAHTLAIMRDSSIGAYGAIALVLALMVFVAALNAIPPTRWPLVLAVAFAVGRWSATVLLRLPYAREDGKASPMVAAPWWTLVLATAWLIPPVVWKPELLLVVGAGLTMTLIWSAWLWRRLHGITGDLLGAGVVLVELAALIGATSLPAGPS